MGGANFYWVDELGVDESGVDEPGTHRWIYQGEWQFVVDNLLFARLCIPNNGTSRWAYHTVSREQRFRSKIKSIINRDSRKYRIMPALWFSVPSFKQLCRKTNETITCTHTHTHDDDYNMPPGLCPPRHNKAQCVLCECSDNALQCCFIHKLQWYNNSHFFLAICRDAWACVYVPCFLGIPRKPTIL